MAYSPTDWVDLVTDVDEAHMDKIEQGIVDAHTIAEAAVPKSIVDAAGDLIVGTADTWRVAREGRGRRGALDQGRGAGLGTALAAGGGR